MQSELVTEENEKIVEAIQIFNSVSSSICGLSIHVYIMYRISRNYSALTHYQNLIVIQSVISLLSVVVLFIANQGAIYCVLVASVLIGYPIALLLNSLAGDAFTRDVITLCYSLIVLTLFRWYTVATGLLTLYSIRGFLNQKATDSQRRITISSLQPFSGKTRVNVVI
ncbi:hypothetical protein Q1695_014622 [Nippostrongylus brasiliensis]|nr:hypothetical protein Q1695_014622 [Nippostrongylus brasiliensis]